MAKKRLSQIEAAIASIENQIAVLQHAKAVLIREQQTAETARTRKPKQRPLLEPVPHAG